MTVQKIHILPTKKTPEIFLNPDGIIKIKGRYMKNNTVDLFETVLDWYNLYIDNPAEITYLNIHLDYISGSCRGILISLLKELLCNRMNYKKIIINWFYEKGDEDVLEQGEYISSILNVPFTFNLKGSK